MAQRDTIVVGASAGGVEALRHLVAALPADLRACVLVVLHTPRTGTNALAAILSRATDLTVRAVDDGDRMQPGVVLVARPDHHLVVLDGHVTVSRGPRENGHRPAVDVLFRSAAHALGPRVIGIVLSGMLDDGAAGLLAVRRHGGVALVQDPEDALQPGMPRNAIAAADPEYVLPVSAMAGVLAGLVGAEVDDPPEPEADLADPEPAAVGNDRDREAVEVAMAELRPDVLHVADRPGVPAGISCPDCHGTLFTIDEAGYVRYRCRVGHAWSGESLLAAHDTALEGALWMALRALEEKAALAEDMAGRAGARGQKLSAASFGERAFEGRIAAETIRRILIGEAPGGARDEEGRPA